MEFIDQEIRLNLYKMAHIPNFIRLCFRIKFKGKWSRPGPLAAVMLAEAQKSNTMFSRIISQIEETRKISIPFKERTIKIEIELFEENSRLNRKIFHLL